MFKKVILSSGGCKTEGYLEELLEIMDKTDSDAKFWNIKKMV
jgi:hypothetical protein